MHSPTHRDATANGQKRVQRVSLTLIRVTLVLSIPSLHKYTFE
jgi:hypothetical protein